MIATTNSRTGPTPASHVMPALMSDSEDGSGSDADVPMAKSSTCHDAIGQDSIQVHELKGEWQVERASVFFC